MRIKETKVYTYDELNEKAKEKAREGSAFTGRWRAQDMQINKLKSECPTDTELHRIADLVPRGHEELIAILKEILVWDDGNLPGDILDKARHIVNSIEKGA